MAECKVLPLRGIELHLFRTQPVIDQTNTIRTLFSTVHFSRDQILTSTV